MTAARRIVSLVPSLTETVAELGLTPELVGCTGFCVRPAGLHRTAAQVGGTKDPDLARIAALAPTHILVNEEENKPEHIAACRALAPTFVSFPKDPREVPALLREMGGFLGAQAAAERFAAEAEQRLESLARARAAAEAAGRWRGRRYLYYIWREPYMVVAQDTYISALLALVGWENVAPRTPRYPTLEVAAARALAPAPEALLLSTEPYPFRRRDAERLRGEWPDAPEMLRVDGQLASWYGTVAIEALGALEAWVEGREQEMVNGFGGG